MLVHVETIPDLSTILVMQIAQQKFGPYTASVELVSTQKSLLREVLVKCIFVFIIFISSGEELTFDYNLDKNRSFGPFSCMCGSINCLSGKNQVIIIDIEINRHFKVQAIQFTSNMIN